GGAEVDHQLVEPPIVDAARDGGDGNPLAREVRGQQLPVADVAGDDDGTAPERAHFLPVLPTFDRRVVVEALADVIELRQLDETARRVAEGRPRDVLAVGGRKDRAEGDVQMVEGEAPGGGQRDVDGIADANGERQ